MINNSQQFETSISISQTVPDENNTSEDSIIS